MYKYHRTMQKPYKLSSLLKTVFVAVVLIFSKELLITMWISTVCVSLCSYDITAY